MAATSGFQRPEALHFAAFHSHERMPRIRDARGRFAGAPHTPVALRHALVARRKPFYLSAQPMSKRSLAVPSGHSQEVTTSSGL